MKRLHHALAIAALSAAAGLAAVPAVDAAWDGAYMQVQQKGWGGDRGEHDRGGRPREARPQERPDQRRDRLSEDDRRSLHRDLDKANREIYGRRFQK